jgi:16S rRNA (uracil1498-N3)-methyltransferase
MSIFYTPQITGNNLTLSEEESKHCIQVLRMKSGDELLLVDGVGGYYQARIINPHSKKCEVLIYNSQLEFQKRNFNLHIACAPTKNRERFEWFLEKATEIGIDRVTPITCQHSERSTLNTERLEKVLVSAMKQSIKAYKPKLEENCSFTNFIVQNKAFKGQKFIAHCADSPKEMLQNVYKKNNDVLILIGPEGDFSQEEIALAEASNFISVGLSTSRLRTETAALVACHTLNLMNKV